MSLPEHDKSASTCLCCLGASPYMLFHVTLSSPAGPGEKPSDVRSSRGGGGLKGADQGAVREELCAGEGERGVEISGQQRAAVSAALPVGHQLQHHASPARTQPASATGPAPASSPASAAVTPPAPAPPQTPAAPDSASARSRPTTTATQRHLRLRCICPASHRAEKKKRRASSLQLITISVCEIKKKKNKKTVFLATSLTTKYSSRVCVCACVSG